MIENAHLEPEKSLSSEEISIHRDSINLFRLLSKSEQLANKILTEIQQVKLKDTANESSISQSTIKPGKPPIESGFDIHENTIRLKAFVSRLKQLVTRVQQQSKRIGESEGREYLFYVKKIEAISELFKIIDSSEMIRRNDFSTSSSSDDSDDEFDMKQSKRLSDASNDQMRTEFDKSSAESMDYSGKHLDSLKKDEKMASVAVHSYLRQRLLENPSSTSIVGASSADNQEQVHDYYSSSLLQLSSVLRNNAYMISEMIDKSTKTIQNASIPIITHQSNVLRGRIMKRLRKRLRIKSNSLLAKVIWWSFVIGLCLALWVFVYFVIRNTSSRKSLKSAQKIN